MRLSACPLRVDCLGDFPERDPDHRHRLAGDEALLVQRGTLGVPLSQQLVLLDFVFRSSPRLIDGAPNLAP